MERQVEIMLLYEVADDVVNTKSTYNIGFINDEGRNDETQFDAENLDDLKMLWDDFCMENHFMTDKVLYVDRLNFILEGVNDEKIHA